MGDTVVSVDVFLTVELKLEINDINNVESEINKKFKIKKGAIPETRNDWHPWPKWVRPAYVKDIKDLICFPEVHEKILSREFTMDIVAFIRSRGYWKGCGDDYGRLRVEHYKATIPKAMFLKKDSKAGKVGAVDVVSNAKRAMVRMINESEELSKLYDIQLNRINMGYEKEKAMKMPLPWMHKEIKQAVEVLKASWVIKNQLGVGDNKPYNPEVNDFAAKIDNIDFDNLYSKEGINNLIKDPQSRMKIMSTVDRVLSMSKGEHKSESEIVEAVVMKDAVKVPQEEPLINPGDAEWESKAEEVIYVSNEPKMEVMQLSEPTPVVNKVDEFVVTPPRRREPG